MDLLIILPLLVLSMLASGNVKSTFAKYSKVRNMRNLTGAEVARRIIRDEALDVSVEMIGGTLTDHYDPRKKVVRLSEGVYQGNSIAAISVAAHECGHAIQHDSNYVPLTLRSLIAPVASFGSQMVWILVLAGILLSLPGLINIGIALFVFAVLFHIVTLPVEFNASSRAIGIMTETGIISDEESGSAKKVLRAAALTYVAATLMAIGQLIRLILIRNNRR